MRKGRIAVLAGKPRNPSQDGYMDSLHGYAWDWLCGYDQAVVDQGLAAITAPDAYTRIIHRWAISNRSKEISAQTMALLQR